MNRRVSRLIAIIGLVLLTNIINSQQTVAAGLTLSAGFVPASINLTSGPVTSTLTYTITNQTGASLSGFGCSAAATFNGACNLGTILVDAVPNIIVSPACTGLTLGATSGSNTITLTGGTVADGATCTFSFQVTSYTPGPNNVRIHAGDLTTTTGPSNVGATQTNTLTVLGSIPKPTVTKEYGLGGSNTFFNNETTSVTYKITNNSTQVDLTNVSLINTLPGITAGPLTGDMIWQGGLVSSAGCVGPASTVSGSPPQIHISGLTIAKNTTCTITLSASQTDVGQYSSDIPANALNDDQGAGNADFQTIYTVQTAEITLTKQFSPTTINPGSSVTMTLAFKNPTPINATTLTMTDNFPSNMIVAVTGSTFLPAGCLATISGATANSNSLTMSNATIPANSTCTLTVLVTSNVPNPASLPTYINTLDPPNFDFGANAGGFNMHTDPITGHVASASFKANSFAVTKTFVPAFILSGQTSAVTISVTNFTSSVQTVTFPDNLNVHLTQTGVVTTTCTSASNTGTTSNLILKADVPANSTCDIVFTVIADAATGTYPNTIAVNTIQGNVPDTATTNFVATTNLQVGPVGVGDPSQPLVTKSWIFPVGNAAYPTPHVGQVFQLQVNIRAPVNALTNVKFTDTLPGTLKVAANIVAPPLTTTNGCGGALTATVGTTSFSLVNGSIGAGATCSIKVNVVEDQPGTYTNTIPGQSGGNPGAVTGDYGPGPTHVSNAIDSSSPPVSISGNIVMSKALQVAAKPANTMNATDTATFTFTIAHVNQGTINGIGFTDNLPAGMQVAPTPATGSTACGAPTINAVAGAGSITVSGASVNNTTNCKITVNVVAPNASGNLTNSLPVNTVTGTFSDGTAGNNAQIVQQITAVTGLTIDKSFSPSVITLSGHSTLRITLTNFTSQSLTSIALKDILPATLSKLVIANPSLASTTCGVGFTLTATPGTDTILLAGGQVRAQIGGVPAVCNIILDVVPAPLANPGLDTNTVKTTDVTTAEGIIPVKDATANLNVGPLNLDVSKGFFPNTVTNGQSSTMTITVNNLNAVTIDQAQFTDTFPPGIYIFSPTALTLANCGSGAVATGVSPNSTAFTLSNLTLAGNSTCTITMSVSMDGSTITAVNTIPANSITSPSGATNPNAASATLDFNSANKTLGALKSFTPTTIAVGGSSTLKISVSNALLNGFDATAVAFTDTLPANLTITGIPTASPECGAPTVSVTGAGTAVSMTGGTIVEGTVCIITATVTSNTVAVYDNTLGVGTVTGTISGAGVSNPQDVGDSLRVLAALQYSIGNRVWFDTNSNGFRDAGELPASGVTVNLLDSGSNQIATKTTDANGYYLFDKLAAGTYFIQIAASNFSGGTLSGYVSDMFGTNGSFVVGADNQDNGATQVGNAIRSAAVVLGPGDNTPLNETDFGPAVTGLDNQNNALPDGRSNLTVDFGFNLSGPIPPNVHPQNGANNGLGLVLRDPVITKSGDPNIVAPGGAVAWTITVTNPNAVTITNVQMSDDIPSSLQIISATARPGTVTINGQRVSVTIASLNAGQTSTIVVQAKVNKNFTSGQITNIAKVLGNQAEASVLVSSKLPATGEHPTTAPTFTIVPFIGLVSLIMALSAFLVLKRRTRS